MSARPSWLPARSAADEFFRESRASSHYRLILFETLAALLPEQGDLSIADVGAGDGYLGAALAHFRPRTRVIGLETHVRARRHRRFPLARYDGVRFPLPDGSVDAVILANVLHHTADPVAVLREARRVARRFLLIKDHVARNAADRWKLVFLDVVGNLRFGAPSTGSYLAPEQWDRALAVAGKSRIERLDALPFRSGFLEKLFPNRLEVLFAVNLLAP
jgi:SAM-dependent methyltransferase